MTEWMILNENELRSAKARAARISDSLSTEGAVKQIAWGLPPAVAFQISDMLAAERTRLEDAIEAYEGAKSTGDVSKLWSQTEYEPGLSLIVARIANGLSQKELAWRLGVKEQQIQRYESDKYASISLRNFARIATVLGVQVATKLIENPKFRGLDQVISDVSRESIKKVLVHGRKNNWFSGDMDEEGLKGFIAENRIQFGSPALLRTGLNVKDLSEDLLLHAWRARVTLRAQEIIATVQTRYDSLDLQWLSRISQFSALEDGPLLVREELLSHGIVLVVEPQIPGLSVDGAAFLVNGSPVVGITLRRDAVDNFWFTLLHELGHIILHYRTGLSSGFFDQSEAVGSDTQELEADRFASNLLIPEEKWLRSTARIATNPQTIVAFANDLRIHPAIVFGRIRKERNNYTLYSDKIGLGLIRKQFLVPELGN